MNKPWRVMLCKPGESWPRIVEVEILAPTLIDGPRWYADGHAEVDEYEVTDVGLPGRADERHASAEFVRTRPW